MHTYTDMLNAKISGIASYIPDDILDNEMLSKMVDTNDEWITTRVGIKERRILNKPVGSSYMGIEAVKNCWPIPERIPEKSTCLSARHPIPTTVSLPPHR